MTQHISPVHQPSVRQQRRSRLQMRQQSGIYIVLFVAVLVFMAPFAWLMTIALKQLVELADFPIRWLPQSPQWGNFVTALTAGPFWTWAANSFIIATLNATLTTFSSALVGFAFARLRAPGKRVFFVVLLSTLMLPSIITLIPTYLIFSRLGLVDTYWPWVLWGLASSAYLVFLFRQFFAAIPAELEDAAIVDGCGYLRIFAQIFLPISLPVLATAFLLQFVFTWGDYLTQNLLLSQANWTLAVALSSNVYADSQGHSFPNIQAAASLLYILPVLVVFLAAQRFFIRGIATTGLKG